jgi:hypothetical protein
MNENGGKVLQIFWDKRELGNFKASFTASTSKLSVF